MLSPIALLALIPLLAASSTIGAPTRSLHARATNVQISHNGNAQQCLTVQGTPANGSPVVSAPCGQGGRQGWDISGGNNLGVKLSGTNFCLDAGSNPGNNIAAKIWTCYSGVTQQTWWYTDDQRIAITGGNQCLDLGPQGPQTYQCTPGNTNQIWTAGGSTNPPPPSSTSPNNPPPTNPPASSFRNVYNCNNNGQVALTFDDGPASFEGQIAGEMQGGKATFFLNGNNYACIYDRADQIKALYNAGHTLGSHTWSHADLTTLSADQINSELSRVETAFIKILGVRPKYFRPPFGSTNAFVEGILAQRGYTRSFLWSDDTGDSLGASVQSSEAVYDQVASSFPSPHLVLNHSPLQGTADSVVPYAVSKLRGAGYGLVAVDTCLGSDGEWPYYYVGPPGQRDGSWTC